MNVINTWHNILKNKDIKQLERLLSHDVEFYSPVVHTPQQGKEKTLMYLYAAMQIFDNGTFQYTHETIHTQRAVLEFESSIDGIYINGVDIISWNSKNEISEFKVMLRPLKGINIIHKKMGELLMQQKNSTT